MENTYFAAGSNLTWSQCCRARLFLKPLAHLLWAQIRAWSFPLDCSVSESFVAAAVALAYPLRPPESRHYLFICVCERLTDQTWLRAQAAPSEGAAGWRPAPAASATATGYLSSQRRLGPLGERTEVSYTKNTACKHCEIRKLSDLPPCKSRATFLLINYPCFLSKLSTTVNRCAGAGKNPSPPPRSGAHPPPSLPAVRLFVREEGRAGRRLREAEAAAAP